MKLFAREFSFFGQLIFLSAGVVIAVLNVHLFFEGGNRFSEGWPVVVEHPSDPIARVFNVLFGLFALLFLAIFLTRPKRKRVQFHLLTLLVFTVTLGALATLQLHETTKSETKHYQTVEWKKRGFPWTFWSQMKVIYREPFVDMKFFPKEYRPVDVATLSNALSVESGLRPRALLNDVVLSAIVLLCAVLVAERFSRRKKSDKKNNDQPIRIPD